MAYRAIYRKWRPIVFEDVVGQSHITETLKKEITTDKTAHAYLFCGTRGTGKTTTAKILSRAVNCETRLPDGNPCNECSSCRGILGGSVMDVIEIDAASNNGVDSIRELRDDVIYTPSEVKFKVYIIDEVHMLSTGAFNALLKTLEEPPAHVLFILATTEPQKIPATIQSRCQRFDFRRISAKNIAGRVSEISSKDGIKLSAEAVRLVAELGDGSMRDALSILDLCSGIDGEISVSDIENVTGAVSRSFLYGITEAYLNGDVTAALTGLSGAVNSGREISNITTELLGLARELLICKLSAVPESILDLSEETAEKNRAIVQTVSAETLMHAIAVLSSSAAAIRLSADPRVALEADLIKLCMPELDEGSSAFAARVKRLEMHLSGEISMKPNVAPIVANTVTKPVTPEKVCPPAVEPIPDDIPEPPIAAKPQNTDTDAVKKELTRKNPPLGILVQNAEFIKNNDVTSVVFDSRENKEMADTQTFVDDLKAVLGTKIKLTYKGCVEQAGEIRRDPLEEIIELDADFPQMKLF